MRNLLTLKVKIHSKGLKNFARKRAKGSYTHFLSSEAEFGLAAMYRIIKKSGAERISNEAVEELRREVEDIALNVAKQAVELATHAGRHTVMGSDVKLAVKNVVRG